MTREEKAKAIDALKLSAPIKAVTQEEFYTYIQTINQIMDWLEQEPCSETVTEFADRCRECGARYGKLLKARAEEEDAISRKAVLESIKNLYPDIPVVDIMGSRRKWLDKYAPYIECEHAIERSPSVNPQPKTDSWSIKDVADTFKKHGLIVEQEPKTGHWILGICDNCGYDWGKDAPIASVPNFCPNCGCRMVEPWESEE